MLTANGPPSATHTADRAAAPGGLTAAPNREVGILEVSDLTVRYDGRIGLDGVSLRVATGERVAVVGPNGAGKSTLFKVVAGILAPTSGGVKVHGHEPGAECCVAYVPQRSQIDWSYPVSVADVVMMGRAGRIGLLRRAGEADRAWVRASLALVGMTDLAGRQIGELSGGQQQRLFIARALAQEAELVLMDEPLTGLDVQSRRHIFDVLDTLRDRGVSVLVAIHDLELVVEHFQRVALLNRRLIGFGSPDDVFSEPNLLAAYGGCLRFIDGGGGRMIFSDICGEDD